MLSFFWKCTDEDEDDHSNSADLTRHLFGRLTWRALFCKELLSREGTLKESSSWFPRQSKSQLTAYLQPRLEAAAGGSLDAYRM